MSEIRDKIVGLKDYMDSRIIGQTITGYRQLADGVTLTVYADGTEVAVNFTEEPFVYRDEEVGASGYRYWLS